MSFNISTRDRLLTLIDDIEIISKELLENTIAPKHHKISPADHQQLVQLLVAKDNDLKDVLKLAAEQSRIEQKMDELKVLVDEQDQEIQQLQKQLKEAELILSTAIFQARQKLASIAKANKRPVSSEELIKYAHKISESNAVCAPLTWQQGDLRRPYPTDIEMRLGFLGKSDLSINGIGMLGALQHQSSVASGDLHRGSADIPQSAQNQFAWHPSGELHMSMSSNAGSVTLETRGHKDNAQDDVEVMSTDSSSSSSSDSQ